MRGRLAPKFCSVNAVYPEHREAKVFCGLAAICTPTAHYSAVFRLRGLAYRMHVATTAAAG